MTSTSTAPASPLARLLSRVAPVEPREAPLVIAAFCLFFCFWAGYFVLRGDQLNVVVGQFFYVFISVLNLFLISMFWSFLLELLDSQQAKRLFPVVAGGGPAGAFLGPVASDLLVKQVGSSGLLFIGAGLFFL